MAEISIIVAVYNVEKYLRQCLDSLINQTFKDIEIICVNDGSTDNSLDILKEYQAKDNRIKIIEQENQGPGVARNKALDAAEGKYVMVVDPDDWLELEACQVAYEQIEKNGNDLVIFGFKEYRESTGEIKENPNQFKIYNDVLDKTDINLCNSGIDFFQNGYSWGKLYNKDFLKDNNIRFLPFYFSEDLPFIQIVLISSNNISILDQPFYIYRIRKDSASSNSILLNKNLWKFLFFSRKLVIEFIAKNGYNDSILKFYNAYLYRSLIHWYQMLSKINPSIKNDFKKEMFKLFDLLFEYCDTKEKFKYYLYKYEFDGIYYNLIRPIGKYCIVLPYRNIKTLFKNILSLNLFQTIKH